ncbi:hypothetical protein Tco_1191225, partial [Tanacetum coccineum]
IICCGVSITSLLLIGPLGGDMGRVAGAWKNFQCCTFSAAKLTRLLILFEVTIQKAWRLGMRLLQPLKWLAVVADAGRYCIRNINPHYYKSLEVQEVLQHYPQGYHSVDRLRAVLAHVNPRVEFAKKMSRFVGL